VTSGRACRKPVTACSPSGGTSTWRIGGKLRSSRVRRTVESSGNQRFPGVATVRWRPGRSQEGTARWFPELSTVLLTLDERSFPPILPGRGGPPKAEQAVTGFLQARPRSRWSRAHGGGRRGCTTRLSRFFFAGFVLAVTLLVGCCIVVLLVVASARAQPRRRDRHHAAESVRTRARSGAPPRVRLAARPRGRAARGGTPRRAPARVCGRPCRRSPSRDVVAGGTAPAGGLAAAAGAALGLASLPRSHECGGPRDHLFRGLRGAPSAPRRRSCPPSPTRTGSEFPVA